MLSGDNGILQRATDAKQTSERAEAKEQAQMDIMAYIADKTANHQDTSLDDTKVKEILTGKTYVKNGQPGNESFLTAKGEYEIPYSELYSTTYKIPSDPVPPAINYGTKTAQTVVEGDTISIREEQFMVLKNDGTTIMAIPYYNITLDTTNPVQSSTWDSTMKTAFCSSPYWTETGININMSGANNVQQYITAYEEKLQEIAGSDVTAEIGRMYGDNNLTNFSERFNSDNKPLLNPSSIGHYWLGSSGSFNTSDVHFVQLTPQGTAKTGGTQGYQDYAGFGGVRPVIFISINN